MPQELYENSGAGRDRALFPDLLLTVWLETFASVDLINAHTTSDITAPERSNSYLITMVVWLILLETSHFLDTFSLLPLILLLA